MIYPSFLLALAFLPLASACPGSPAFIHAKCEMTVSFSNDCASVQSEITSRLNGENGWVDPHNAGTYSLTSSNTTFLEGQRVTGDEKYTDKFDFEFTTTFDGGCIVDACSESQVNSVADFSTNYCNLHDLYCSTEDGCPTVGKDLTYSEKYSSCAQHDDVCIATTTAGKQKDVNKKCSQDIQNAANDITKAAITIADAADDCAEGFTDDCNNDIDKVLDELTSASGEISAAVFDCGDEVPTECSADIGNIGVDITGATKAITDAIIDCPVSTEKCTADIIKATDAIVQAGKDIAAAVDDC